MRTKLTLVTVSFALGLGVWACGGADEGANGNSSGSGGTAGTTSSHDGGAAGAPLGMAGDAAIGGDTGVAGDNGVAGDTGVAGGSGVAGDNGIAGDNGVAGDTSIGGTTSVAGATNTAGATAIVGGTGGTGASASCKTTGSVPICTALNSVQCNMVDGCSDSATPCGGDPTACESILDQGKCNSTVGCSAAGGNGCQTVGVRTMCATHLNGTTCTAAGCSYKPCAGTAVACSTLDQPSCALHASYCTWQ